jgi:hexosaminidase
MDWILRNRPQWQLKLNNGSVVSKAIDFSIAQARNFLMSLFTDLMEMFPQSRHIHLGADEYFLQPITPGNTPQLAQYVRDETGNVEADSEDAVRYFVNTIAELVQKKGK